MTLATAQRCLAHYEELRSRVLAGHALGSRLGLSLLLRSGMAAWLHAWAACSPLEPTAQTTQPPTRGEPLADECCVGIISVLANMALANRMEVTV